MGEMGLEGVKAVAWETPWGWQAAAAGPGGLVALTLPRPERLAAWGELLEELGKEPPLGCDPLLQGLASDCLAYLEGNKVDFSRYPVHWMGQPESFSLRVLEATRFIPYGQVSTYGQVARMAGSSRARRAAGQALKRNPLPLVVP